MLSVSEFLSGSIIIESKIIEPIVYQNHARTRAYTLKSIT